MGQGVRRTCRLRSSGAGSVDWSKIGWGTTVDRSAYSRSGSGLAARNRPGRAGVAKSVTSAPDPVPDEGNLFVIRLWNRVGLYRMLAVLLLVGAVAGGVAVAADRPTQQPKAADAFDSSFLAPAADRKAN